MRSASGACAFFCFLAVGGSRLCVGSVLAVDSSSSSGRFAPFVGAGAVDGGGGAFAVEDGGFCAGICVLANPPLTSGDESRPPCSSLKLTVLFEAGVKKVAAFDVLVFAPFAWVGGGVGSAMKSLHPESMCLLISGSLTGLSQIGHATIECSDDDGKCSCSRTRPNSDATFT